MERLAHLSTHPVANSLFTHDRTLCWVLFISISHRGLVWFGVTFHLLEHNKALLWSPYSTQTHALEVQARIGFHLSQRNTLVQSYLTHDWSQNSNPRTSDSILKWRRQVTQLYSREHFIMNLWNASSPCSRYACPASYSGSYLNNWFPNLESQSREFHAYQQVEERCFNRACSMHGGGECMLYELGKHENTADCQLGNFPLR